MNPVHQARRARKWSRSAQGGLSTRERATSALPRTPVGWALPADFERYVISQKTPAEPPFAAAHRTSRTLHRVATFVAPSFPVATLLLVGSRRGPSCSRSSLQQEKQRVARERPPIVDPPKTVPGNPGMLRRASVEPNGSHDVTTIASADVDARSTTTCAIALYTTVREVSPAAGTAYYPLRTRWSTRQPGPASAKPGQT